MEEALKQSYSQYMDPVVELFTTGDYYREVYEAKLEYFEKTGVIYEEDEEFEQRMCIFMDWYLFDRDLPGVDLPPIRYYFKQYRSRWTEEEVAVYSDFCSTIHSVFCVKGAPFFGSGLLVYDLFSKKSYRVMSSGINQGFTRGDIFEARLILFRNQYHFSKGFCFHSSEVKSFILNEIKKIRYQGKARQTKLILQLSAMKLRFLRYPHIDIHHLYQFESRL